MFLWNAPKAYLLHGNYFFNAITSYLFLRLFRPLKVLNIVKIKHGTNGRHQHQNSCYFCHFPYHYLVSWPFTFTSFICCNVSACVRVVWLPAPASALWRVARHSSTWKLLTVQHRYNSAVYANIPPHNYTHIVIYCAVPLALSIEYYLLMQC